ncbi:hypothetical protein SUGI_0297110 [Cryptomeria japonica]|uniref:uncharacterized protein LOC131066525 isoform X3 n=1 Tax=Cryptomeria japonica TaxID=3369 RepID=UPI002408B0C6|nr:uncharacterized protein LOC131066525 isoform X3 [Cryptomeria japonica]GLJ17159.1 hypothetical protein SUGI_0297110 [Cryptomeria japonica]
MALAIRLTHPLSIWTRKSSSLPKLGRVTMQLPVKIWPTQKISCFCHTGTALKAEREEAFKGTDKNDVIEIKRLLEQARKAVTTREIFHSDFLTPPVVEDVVLALKKLSIIEVVVQGGYPEAERCRLSVGHTDFISSEPCAVAALSISGNFTFDPASHGDFLGAVLTTGIKREKVGDILLQDMKGAQVIVVPELVDYLVSTVTQVRNVPVSCLPIPLLALEVQPPRTKVLKSVEASLRVDAIASAGFRISRNKIASLISGGDVRVNWNEISKNGTTLKTGDIISIKGKGRVKLGEIKSTRKGKFAVELIQYL